MDDLKNMINFVRWLDELFLEVRITNFAIKFAHGNNRIIAKNEEEDTFSIVVWGVEKSFFEKVVVPHIPPGGVWGVDSFERAFFSWKTDPHMFENVSHETPEIKYVSEKFVRFEDNRRTGEIQL
jgi:hypothetical protein